MTIDKAHKHYILLHTLLLFIYIDIYVFTIDGVNCINGINGINGKNFTPTTKERKEKNKN